MGISRDLRRKLEGNHTDDDLITIIKSDAFGIKEKTGIFYYCGLFNNDFVKKSLPGPLLEDIYDYFEKVRLSNFINIPLLSRFYDHVDVNIRERPSKKHGCPHVHFFLLFGSNDSGIPDTGRYFGAIHEHFQESNTTRSDFVDRYHQEKYEDRWKLVDDFMYGLKGCLKYVFKNSKYFLTRTFIGRPPVKFHMKTDHPMYKEFNTFFWSLTNLSKGGLLIDGIDGKLAQYINIFETPKPVFGKFAKIPDTPLEKAYFQLGIMMKICNIIMGLDGRFYERRTGTVATYRPVGNIKNTVNALIMEDLSKTPDLVKYLNKVVKGLNSIAVMKRIPSNVAKYVDIRFSYCTFIEVKDGFFFLPMNTFLEKGLKPVIEAKLFCFDYWDKTRAEILALDEGIFIKSLKGHWKRDDTKETKLEPWVTFDYKRKIWTEYGQDVIDAAYALFTSGHRHALKMYLLGRSASGKTTIVGTLMNVLPVGRTIIPTTINKFTSGNLVGKLIVFFDEFSVKEPEELNRVLKYSEGVRMLGTTKKGEQTETVPIRVNSCFSGNSLDWMDKFTPEQLEPFLERTIPVIVTQIPRALRGHKATKEESFRFLFDLSKNATIFKGCDSKAMTLEDMISYSESLEKDPKLMPFKINYRKFLVDHWRKFRMRIEAYKREVIYSGRRLLSARETFYYDREIIFEDLGYGRQKTIITKIRAETEVIFESKSFE